MGFSQYGDWGLSRSTPTGTIPREPGRSLGTCSNLTSEVTRHHAYYILLVTREPQAAQFPGPGRKNLYFLTGGRDKVPLHKSMRDGGNTVENTACHTPAYCRNVVVSILVTSGLKV